jgi:hypothetical protein
MLKLMVGRLGVEPRTSGLKVRHSAHRAATARIILERKLLIPRAGRALGISP